MKNNFNLDQTNLNFKVNTGQFEMCFRFQKVQLKLVFSPTVTNISNQKGKEKLFFQDLCLMIISHYNKRKLRGELYIVMNSHSFVSC